MKIAVIGCTHAGTAAAVQAAKSYPDAQITVYEKNDNISFLSCGIALSVAGVVKDPKSLFYSSPEALKELGVDARMKHAVTEVNLKEKKLTVHDLETDTVGQEGYDTLLITSGSWPVIPDLEGIGLANVLLCKNYAHAQKLIEKTPSARSVAVVGAGYIGVEIAEAFQKQGKQVTLIDSQSRILSKYLDEEFTGPAQKALEDIGVRLALGQCVRKFTGNGGAVSQVVTDKGCYDADLAVLCIGFRPNTALFQGKLDMLPNGAIKVDEYMRTSAEGVFAAGDCCAVRYNPTGESDYIPLATNAVRMGTLAAMNFAGPRMKYPGTQGTSGIKIAQLNIASTGLTEETAKRLYPDVGVSLLSEHDRPEFMPTYDELKLKVVFEKPSRRILGAQLMSKKDLTQSINTLSVCIQNRMTMEELAFVDFFFQPHFNKPWNFLNTAGLKALGNP